MARVVRHPPGKERPRDVPMSSLLLRRVWDRAESAFFCRWHRLMIRLEARRGTPRPRKWRRWNTYTVAMRLFWGSMTALLLAWCGEGLSVVITGHSTGFEKWRRNNAGFDAIIRFVGPVLTAGIATALFLILWYSWTKRRYLAKARKKPNELVLTAGPHISEVVGRQEIAQVIAERLRDRRTRRPYLLVGGVGVGKTAVLVQLTEILARQHAVPVPIRLRDAAHESDLNFERMARQRFSEEAPQGILARSKNDRVWHQLLADDKPVVIADGLEEAVLDESLQNDRDNIIRRAIELAYQAKLPLVIASRPHAPLEGTRAAIIELEPLNEEAALRFVEAGVPETDERRLDWIVETAEVTESPIYLQIARELHNHDTLERDRPRHDPKRLDTRSWDRSTLRLWLLETWHHAMLDGRLQDDVALDTQERSDTLEAVSALACIGLLQDRLEVEFSDLLGSDVHPGLAGKVKAGVGQRRREGRRFDRYGKRGNTFSEWQRQQIWAALCERLSARESEYLLNGNTGQCQAALARFMANAAELQLVEGFEKKVRFPHSIIQAYFGYRMLHHLGEHQAGRLVEQALQPPGPSRELLIALVLLSRRRGTELFANGQRIGADMARDVQEFMKREGAELWRRMPMSGPTLAERLCRAAGHRTDPKAFHLYAAALEMDSVESAPRLLDGITRRLQENWHDIRGDRRSLDEAKLAVVKQLGAALRAAEPTGVIDATTLYERLFELGKGDASYAIRLAAAQEFGAGGDPAFAVIRRRVRDLNEDPLTEYRQLLDQLKTEYDATASKAPEVPASRRSSRMTPEEKERLRDEQQAVVRRYREGCTEVGREFVMRAWMIPMLLGSVSDGHREEARNRLMKWLDHLDPERPGGADLPLFLENALAQGFKYAANRRKRHPDTFRGGRADLIRKAETMLRRARCWYSQLSLLHALCLWELPDSITRGEHDREAAPYPRLGDGSVDGAEGANGANGANGATAVQKVASWLSVAGSAHPAGEDGTVGQRLHPFVAETGDLVALALETRRPERFIWIDEKGVIGNVGFRTDGAQHYRKHNLWIPPSVGWATLDGRAQRLVADVVVMLNLVERDGFPDEVEERLRKSNQPGMPLPPCLTVDRTPLHPGLTVGICEQHSPGDTCLPSCTFKFCPYPPQGTLLRAEIREPFCRQQQALLPGRLRRLIPNVFGRKTPPWVGMRVVEFDRFWHRMAKRARG